LEDAVVITGFVAGGALSAKLWEKRHLRTKAESLLSVKRPYSKIHSDEGKMMRS